MSPPPDLLERMVEALSRVDEDGNDLFAADQIRHALPYLVFALELPLDELTEGVQELIVETAEAAGASTTDPAAALLSLQGHYKDNPVDPKLLEAVRAAFEGGDLPDALGQKAAATALGLEKKSAPLDSGGPRPEGTVPAALARLRTTPKKPGSR